jgi:hypothetical protein
MERASTVLPQKASRYRGARAPTTLDQLPANLRVPGTELARGPPLVSSALSFIGGSSHRRKSAACPKFDLVWLNRSPIPVGRRGEHMFNKCRQFLQSVASAEEPERQALLSEYGGLGPCAAKAFYSCPAIISRRPESQNTSKEPQLNPEEESRIIRPDRM